MGNMKASIVLCTYNRAQYLRAFLENLLKQNTPTTEYELIIVNDGSQDDTDSVINTFQLVLPIKYLNLEKNVGKDKAVFIGAEAASTAYVLFTDDDCLPCPDWIEKMIVELRTAPLVAGRITTPTNPYLTLCRNISEFHDFMVLNPVEPFLFLAGANMGIRREVLESIGKIPETIIAFDTSFALHAIQKGYQVRYSPSPVIKHQPELKSLGALLKYETKRAMDTIVLRNEFRYILKTPFFLQSSILLLLFTPIIAVGRSIQIFFKFPVIKWLHAFPVVVACKFAWCWGAFKVLRRTGK